MNNLCIASHVYVDRLRKSHYSNIYVVIPANKESLGKEMVLDFMPEWKWWDVHLETIVENVPLTPGLYNVEEVEEYYKGRENDVFLEV